MKSLLGFPFLSHLTALSLPTSSTAFPLAFDITTPAFGHEIGSKVASGWSAYYKPGVSRKFMTYGPYTTGLRDGENLGPRAIP